MRMHVLAFPMAAWPHGRSEIARDEHALARSPKGRTTVRPLGKQAHACKPRTISERPGVLCTRVLVCKAQSREKARKQGSRQKSPVRALQIA